MKKGSKHSEESKRKVSLHHKRPWLGKQRSQESIKKMSENRKGKCMGNRHAAWKGNNVGYSALHDWVERRLGKPNTCEDCKKSDLYGNQIHWANKSGKYLRRISDWLRLCVKCHSKYDHSRYG